MVYFSKTKVGTGTLSFQILRVDNGGDSVGDKEGDKEGTPLDVRGLEKKLKGGKGGKAKEA